MQFHYMTAQKTPRIVFFLVTLTAIVAFFSPILSFVLEHYYALAGPSTYLPLTLVGLQKGWLWQLLSYPFIETTAHEIHLSTLVDLSIHLFFLWFLSRGIALRLGSLFFLLFYLLAILVSGSVCALFLLLFPSTAPLTGPTSLLFALTTLYLMLQTDGVFSFFLYRFKIKQGIFFILGFILFIQLVTGKFLPFLGEASGALFGLLASYPLRRLPHKSPPPHTHDDDKIIDIDKLRRN